MTIETKLKDLINLHYVLKVINTNLNKNSVSEEFSRYLLNLNNLKTELKEFILKNRENKSTSKEEIIKIINNLCVYTITCNRIYLKGQTFVLITFKALKNMTTNKSENNRLLLLSHD